MVEFVPNLIIAAGIFLVEPHDVDHSLRVLLLLLFGDAVLLQQALPFFRQARKLAGLIVVTNVSDVDGILGCRYLDAARSA